MLIVLRITLINLFSEEIAVLCKKSYLSASDVVSGGMEV